MTTSNSTTQLGTIGFAGKDAKSFFGELRRFGVSMLIDIRRNNTSQLAGFTKKSDLPFLLEEICGARYQHIPELSPEPDLIKRFRSRSVEWAEFAREFGQQLDGVDVVAQIGPKELHRACLLCACEDYHRCHRSIVAALLSEQLPDLSVTHL